MPGRQRTNRNHRVFRAFIVLCLTVAILGIGNDLARGLPLVAVIVALLVGYVIGRSHEHAIHGRQYKHGRQYRMKHGDPVRTITILPHTDPPEPTEPPEPPEPRPYYGGQWSPERGYEPLDKMSPYPDEIRPSRDEILRDPRSGAHRIGEE